ncbi:MAG: hypothetical protein SNJ55_07015 [Chloroherpetonaceae bacterium]
MITNETQYRDALNAMDEIISKYKDGENAHADAELLRLAKAVEDYETRMNLEIQKPLTLGELVLLAMDEQTVSLSELAEKTGLNAERLDAMIHGKEPFTLQAVKRLYLALNLDAKTVLEHA